MASTFYKYAERDVDSQINWTEVGIGISEMLKGEAASREAKKALIDQQTRALGQQLANAPQGQQKELNAWSLEFGSDATEAMRIQEQLLKSGLLSFKDYSVQRQNLIDGTSQAFSLINEYNAQYDEALARYKDGTGSIAELEFMKNVEDFRNFTRSKLVINPVDYSVVIGNKKINPDGTYSTELEDGFSTINSLRNRLHTRIDKYDVNPELSNIAEKLGSLKIDVINRARPGKTGTITTFSGLAVDYQNEDWYKQMSDKEKASYDKAYTAFTASEDSFLEAILTNTDHMASIMLDDFQADASGNAYSLNFDGTQQGDNIVKVVTDPTGKSVFEFTDEQREYVKGQLRTRLRGMLDSEKKVSTYTEGSGVTSTRTTDPNAESKRNAETGANLLAKLYAPQSQEDVNAGINYLMSNEAYISSKFNGRKIDRIQRTPSGVIIEFEDGGNQPYNYTGNVSDWVRSMSNLVGIDPYYAVRSEGFDKNAALNTGPTADVQMFNQSSNQNKQGNAVFSGTNLLKIAADTDEDEDKFAAALNEQLQGTGYSVAVGSAWLNDSITVYKDGQPIATDVNIEDSGSLIQLTNLITAGSSGGASGDKIFGQ